MTNLQLLREHFDLLAGLTDEPESTMLALETLLLAYRSEVESEVEENFIKMLEAEGT